MADWMRSRLFMILWDSFFIILGIVMVVFYKAFARSATDFYYKLLHYRFSEKQYEIPFILLGIFFIVFCTLALFGVIKFR